MSPDLWSLPGPRMWIQDVASSLEADRHAILAVPDGLRGVGEALRAADRSRRAWSSVPTLYEDEGPVIDQLAAWLGLAAPSTLDDVVDGAGDRQVILLQLEDQPEAHHDAWLQLVHGWPVSAARLPREQAPLLACILPGRQWRQAGGLARPDVDERWWWGVLTPVDLQCFIMESRVRLSMVAAEVIATVARWDLELAERLMADWPDADPACLDHQLASYAQQHPCVPRQDLAMVRPSSAPPEALIDPWAVGAVELWDGRLRGHACTVSTEERSRLVWRGQMRVLLPILEDRRLDMVDWAVQQGVGGDLHADDLGELHSRLRQTALRGDQRRMEEMRTLKDARNNLAHQTALPARIAELISR